MSLIPDTPETRSAQGFLERVRLTIEAISDPETVFLVLDLMIEAGCLDHTDAWNLFAPFALPSSESEQQ